MRSRPLALIAVLLVHAGGLVLLLRGWSPAVAPEAQPGPRSLLLWLRPAPPPAAAPRPVPRAAERPAARALALPAPDPAPDPAPAPPNPTGAARPAVPTGAPPGATTVPPAPAPLRLSLPTSGPWQRPPPPAAAHPALSDPRANSPRLGRDERLAMALGVQPCYVDERDADGRVQRHEGRWERPPTEGAAISEGAVSALAIQGGHQGGPRASAGRPTVPTCVRAR